jgi:hypothetical protein
MLFILNEAKDFMKRYKNTYFKSASNKNTNLKKKIYPDEVIFRLRDYLLSETNINNNVFSDSSTKIIKKRVYNSFNPRTYFIFKYKIFSKSINSHKTLSIDFDDQDETVSGKVIDIISNSRNDSENNTLKENHEENKNENENKIFNGNEKLNSEKTVDEKTKTKRSDLDNENLDEEHNNGENLCESKNFPFPEKFKNKKKIVFHVSIDKNNKNVVDESNCLEIHKDKNYEFGNYHFKHPVSEIEETKLLPNNRNDYDNSKKPRIRMCRSRECINILENEKNSYCCETCLNYLIQFY